MSGTDELESLYSAIEDAARLLDVPCSRDTVWPILTTYGAAYGEALLQTVMAFRVATDARHAQELDCRFALLSKDVDPYDLAVSKGLIAETDHPVGALLAELRERFPIDSYGIDFGVVAGFTKAWPFFPPEDLQQLSKLAEIPSMPRSVADNVDLFARHGLEDKVGLLGIDYYDRTVNVYFGTPPPECFEPATIKTMVREMGLPEPSDQLLTLGQQAFALYATYSWDSPNVERICYAVMTPDPTTLPVHIDPKIQQFARNASRDAAAGRFVYAVALTPKGEYHKLQSYYQWRQRTLDLMSVSEPAADPS
jgi:hypothetical protein